MKEALREMPSLIMSVMIDGQERTINEIMAEVANRSEQNVSLDELHSALAVCIGKGSIHLTDNRKYQVVK